jgi:regulatory protein
LRSGQLLDDAEFAQYWVSQRRTFRPRGAHVIRGELRRLGVGAPLVADAVESLAPHAEDDAYRAAAKRAAQLGGLDERTFTTRLSQHLARRGFDWATISGVVARLWQETVNTS